VVIITPTDTPHGLVIVGLYKIHPAYGGNKSRKFFQKFGEGGKQIRKHSRCSRITVTEGYDYKFSFNTTIKLRFVIGATGTMGATAQLFLLVIFKQLKFK